MTRFFLSLEEIMKISYSKKGSHFFSIPAWARVLREMEQNLRVEFGGDDEINRKAMTMYCVCRVKAHTPHSQKAPFYYTFFLKTAPGFFSHSSRRQPDLRFHSGRNTISIPPKGGEENAKIVELHTHTLTPSFSLSLSSIFLSLFFFSSSSPSRRRSFHLTWEMRSHTLLAQEDGEKDLVALLFRLLRDIKAMHCKSARGGVMSKVYEYAYTRVFISV